MRMMQVLRQPSEELGRLTAALDDWQFDMFEMAAACNGRPLSYTGFYLIRRMGLIDRFNLNEMRLAW